MRVDPFNCTIRDTPTSGRRLSRGANGVPKVEFVRIVDGLPPASESPSVPDLWPAELEEWAEGENAGNGNAQG